jgi:hypothetical protein
MMNKSDIKVHLTEEQTENNSGMINPQAVNDVRRAAGSGGSGSGSGGSGSGDGGSGSGDGGSGDGTGGSESTGGKIVFSESEKIVNGHDNEPLFATFDLSYSMGGILWTGSVTITVYAQTKQNENHRYYLQFLSGNLSGGMSSNSITSKEKDKTIERGGNHVFFNQNLTPSNISSEYFDKSVETEKENITNDEYLKFKLTQTTFIYIVGESTPITIVNSQDLTIHFNYVLKMGTVGALTLKVTVD